MKNCDQNIIKGFFHESDNEIHSFDYLYRFLFEIENIAKLKYDISGYKAVLTRLGAYLKDVVKNERHSDESVKQKYVWMYEYYHDTLQRAINHRDNNFGWLKEEYLKWKKRKRSM